jgi:riboflavin synthase
MFTGIARGAFPVRHVMREPALMRYAVDVGPEVAAGLVSGASVAIDGVCQTVVGVEAGLVRFEAIEETLDKTTLGALREGDRVNVERSVRVGDEIGGHEVSGHVSTTGVIQAVRVDDHVHDLRIGCAPEDVRYVMPKGFVAVHGCSLTVGDVYGDGFEVHLIPETLRLTNLGQKREGDRVNLEWDARTVAIVETVERVLARRSLYPSWTKS